jgi:ADP-heptose:LPS heptosyltransferase
MTNFIKNILLVGVSYLYAIVRGRSKVKGSRVAKIVVMPASKLGDMVCATPIYRAIKDFDRSIKVTVCAGAIYKDLLAGNTDVDDYISWNETDLFKNIFLIRKNKYDVAVITTPSFIASATFFLAGVKVITVPRVENGFSPYQTKSYRMMFPLLTVVPHIMGNYAPREYLKLLEPIGISSDITKKHLSYSTKDMSAADSFFGGSGASHKYNVAIVPGVGNSIKYWDTNNFTLITRYILKNFDSKVFLLGAKQDKEVCEKIMSDFMGEDRVINANSKFNMSEIKAFVSKMNLLIAVDTGLIYVAEAFNVPTIDIIGSMDENEQPPRGDIHKLVYIEGRKPEIHIMNSRTYNRDIARSHIDNMKPEMVYPFVDELLK